MKHSLKRYLIGRIQKKFNRSHSRGHNQQTILASRQMQELAASCFGTPSAAPAPSAATEPEASTAEPAPESFDVERFVRGEE